ncbi:MAG: hypothetical protein F7C32_00125 [Desulfurococcales archaeon]|nr:hypothetical protein [Desulfurococcales archaeon]
MVAVPLKPLGKEDIRKLELALIFGTLFRPDVIEKIKDSHDRLTWLDSLVVAAGALARERAGYTASRIAEELGRTEATIRNHLQGKTEAGKLVKETYQMLVSAKGEFTFEPTGELASLGIKAPQEIQKMEEEIEKLKKANKELEERYTKLEESYRELEEKYMKLKEAVQKVIDLLKNAI